MVREFCEKVSPSWTFQLSEIHGDGRHPLVPIPTLNRGEFLVYREGVDIRTYRLLSPASNAVASHRAS